MSKTRFGTASPTSRLTPVRLLVELLQILAEKDALRQVNPEVFSSTNDGRSPAEIARLSRQSLQRILAEAGVV